MKVLLFSHESDIDGLGCVVLAKLAFSNLKYELVPNVERLEEKFREYIYSKDIYNYDYIYITDLALKNPSLDIVANDSILKDRVTILDHHQQAIDDGLNKYLFTHIFEEVNGKKTCGTELFYNYLTQNNYLKKTGILDDFVELTRLEDMWEWKISGEEGIHAHDMAILFNVIGVDKYISSMYKKIKDNDSKIIFTKEEEKIIQNKKEEYKQILISLLDEAEYLYDEFNNLYGILYADYEYRNELGEYVKSIGNPNNIKYLIIVALNKGKYGQRSYRAIDDDFDVNEIAMKRGGGGHIAAASANITEKQKKIALSLSKKEGLEYLANAKYE